MKALLLMGAIGVGGMDAIACAGAGYLKNRIGLICVTNRDP